MSNAYKTQPIRKKYDLEWQEEYILGLVAHAQLVRVTAILGIAKEVMTNATAHKYLTQLIDKKLLKHTVCEDKRVKTVTLTKKGSGFINDLSNVWAVTSDVSVPMS